MILTLKRFYYKKDYTIGKLYIDDKYFCDTLECENRDLNHNGHFDGDEKKIQGKTCIPFGRYEITIDTVSPKFSKYKYYQDVCGGRLPRLLDVPQFTGILIHVADGYKGSKLLEGCIGIGKNLIRGGLVEGRIYFEKLYNILKHGRQHGKIYIDIV